MMRREKKSWKDVKCEACGEKIKWGERYKSFSHRSPPNISSVWGGLKMRMLSATVARMRTMTRTARRIPFLLLSSPGFTNSWIWGVRLSHGDWIKTKNPPSLQAQILGRVCEVLHSQVYIWSCRCEENC